MGLPSRKTIIDRLGPSLDKTRVGRELGATVIRQILEWTEGGGMKPTLRQWREAESRLKVWTRSRIAPELALSFIDEVLEGFGREAILLHSTSGKWDDVSLEWVNMGDTYNTTVLHDSDKDVFYITTWGDMVEYYERKGFETF